MDMLHALALALLQGLTEFLPVSSSAHLILLPLLVDWPDQGLMFDVAVHVGTLIAVVSYFAKDLWVMARDWSLSVLRRRTVGDSSMAWFIIVATIPTGLAGLTVKAMLGDSLRSVLVIAVANLLFAGLLWWGDRSGARQRELTQMRLRDALMIGCAQAFALIPGASRSGVTMTMALMLGFTRQAAARFSFLLAVPIIVLAGLLLGRDALSTVDAVHWPSLLTGIAVSAACAFAVIHLFLRLVERTGMLPFVLYRVALGVVLLWLFL
ncbi:MAG: undecaprenyl-diphosphatase [Gammaproteobacteria bacterium]|jgi:undecaprenyl-diphosphatase